jgi:hypothetical protein
LQHQGWHYDIREIDEDLYLAVLACRLAENSCPDSDPS